MRKADFQARIKKIEIVNKVLADSWAQSIRVNLDDIELTNENLLELRQFRPNEPVSVIIEPVQLNLLDITGQKLNADNRGEDEDYLTFTEEEGSGPPPGKVVREFKL
ncbi:MAG: hypothetical protein JL56_13730 [Desulfotomaculum sp. BICA1-6]|nr:MAG: hypothetical protein JL56_13730 [Desulfotomaculum sp. BICA1-6]